MNTKAKKVSTVLLDFVFGEPIPQPVVIEQDTEQAWQEWLDAMTERDIELNKDSFARTVPMAMLMH
ncbi:MAG: hypothetical protein KBF63_15270 [Rhodoferax sp.]|jgi:hypothetical protein|nr:hypothetical protein [Rhodoferax sp.]MBP9930641.1 hypothetical protein [Rhodoferax sp.]HQX61457.1 hypothetical protein [Burkholderiaceae bacterium]HQZ07568.1 hypothetical protein [Burkholderiaceae bacterium]